MRETARRVPIGVILLGKYIRSTGQYEPNYVEFNNLRIARAHIIGVVINRYDSDGSQYTSLTIDDGTGKIRVKLFGEDTQFADKISIGDIVRVIGKPRETDGDRHIIAEVVKKIDKDWQRLWKLEVMDKFKDAISKEDTIDGGPTTSASEHEEEANSIEMAEENDEGMSKEESRKDEERVLKSGSEKDVSSIDIEEIDIDI